MAKMYSTTLSISRGHTTQNPDIVRSCPIEDLLRLAEPANPANPTVPSVSVKISGLHAAAELDLLRQHHYEVYCGDVVFETETAHTQPYSAFLVAGDDNFSVIFIDADTYSRLAAPLPPPIPVPWIS